jgi:hypothetical protein
VGKKSDYDDTILEHLNELENKTKSLFKMEQDELELHAKYFFEKLTILYQLSLILKNTDEGNKVWMEPTAEFLKLKLGRQENLKVRNVDEIKGLMGWKI